MSLDALVQVLKETDSLARLTIDASGDGCIQRPSRGPRSTEPGPEPPPTIIYSFCGVDQLKAYIEGFRNASQKDIPF